MNISIEHVTKKIKDATVLKDICLEMKGGTVYGLQGKNGSGKTMLMRAISGLIRPTSGRIVINGEQLHKNCLLYTSPSPRDRQKSRMPSSA